jgi:antitoxin (DNA-binding transcriptional repressor) of toxin-antitoxin stability system
MPILDVQNVQNGDFSESAAMPAISATELRSKLSEVLGRVAYGKERVTIERRGRPLRGLAAGRGPGPLRGRRPRPGKRSGPEFAEIAQRRHPALKVLFMSGYAAESLMPRAGSLGWNMPLLSKPFQKAALARSVRDALDNGKDGEAMGATE